MSNCLLMSSLSPRIVLKEAARSHCNKQAWTELRSHSENYYVLHLVIKMFQALSLCFPSVKNKERELYERECYRQLSRKKLCVFFSFPFIFLREIKCITFQSGFDQTALLEIQENREDGTKGVTL